MGYNILTKLLQMAKMRNEYGGKNMAENQVGNSNRIAREYIDSLRVETRYLDACVPDTGFTLYGERFETPVMTAALSHLDRFMFPGAALALARGAKEAGAVLWYGMAEEPEIEALAATGARMIEIIKPYADRDQIHRRVEQAEKLRLLAVGVDIDHAFGDDGSPDLVNGIEMAAMTTRELEELCKSTRLPVIVKGVLSLRDAEKSLGAGARGLVLSHHDNRIEYALPPMALLPEIARLAEGTAEVFVDCEIQTGMDVFKALCLGAKGACIGRPLMAAIRQDTENGARDFIRRATSQLKKAMAFTGCASLSHMDASVIHNAMVR